MAESDLSERQRAVLQLARDGKTVPQAAAAMSITPSGVREHVRRIRNAGVDITFANGRRGRPPRLRARAAASAPASAATRPSVQASSADDALRRAVDAVRAERTRLELRLGELEAEAADVRQAITKLAAMAGEPEKV
jgi:predicted ArsR family transcriptional regulator